MKKIIIALSCLLLVSACGCSEKSDSKASSSEPVTEEVTTVKEETKHSDTNASQAELESKPSTEALTEAQTEENKASNLTLSQQNALKSAKSYIEFSNFSKDGLIGQLEFEKYTHEDAVLAVESISVDWNEQAVGSAKSYISTSGFSYEGLIGQLEYEEYTHEQAVYGADNCALRKKSMEKSVSASSTP